MTCEEKQGNLDFMEAEKKRIKSFKTFSKWLTTFIKVVLLGYFSFLLEWISNKYHRMELLFYR